MSDHWPFLPGREVPEIVHAEGAWLRDASGHRILDAAGGAIVMNIGHGRAEVADAVARETLERTYVLPPWETPSRRALVERLRRDWLPEPLDRVYLASGGSEANEAALKVAVQHFAARGEPQRHKILGRALSYHGTTIATTAVGGHAARRVGLENVLAAHPKAPTPYPLRCPIGAHHPDAGAWYVAALEQVLEAEGPETIAAFIAEPIMGAGGVIVPPATYFEKIQAVLDRYGIWLIDDEVICGFGRTGNPFGAQTLGMRPTTMSFAKALSSAYLPISAVVIPDEIYEPFVEESGRIGTFGHGFTYSGHPVAAAVALRNLELMEERNLFAHAAEVGEYLQAGLAQLADHPIVGEVRGAGLIAGIELVADRASRDAFPASAGMGAYCSGRCEAHGLLARNLGDTIALCPPLIITREQVDEVLATLRRAIDETMDHATREGLLPAAA